MDRRSFAHGQLCARMELLVPTRMDASMVPTNYERMFGSRLDFKVGPAPTRRGTTPLQPHMPPCLEEPCTAESQAVQRALSI